MDTLAILLFIASGTDADMASLGVDTLLVLLSANRLWLETLVDVWGEKKKEKKKRKI